MRILKSVSLALLAVLLIVMPVLAWSYSATITMIESGGNSYDGQSFSLDLDNAYMVHNGYSTAYGLDVQTLQSSVNVPSMMVSDRTNFAIDALASQTDTFTMTFGNTPTTSMPVVLGYNGYMTTSDTAALEPSDNFTSEIDGYFDTSTTATSIWSATQRPLINKDLAYQTIIPESGRVQSDVINGSSTTIGEYNNSFNDTGALGLSGVYRSGNRFDSFPAGIISQVKIYFKKIGSPTGTIYFNVRKVSDDTLLGTVGTYNIASISSSSTLCTANANRVSVGESQDIRIMAEAYFTSSSGSDYVQVGRHADEATLTTYDGTYTDTVFKYILEATYYPLYASVSGAVSIGEHTVKTYTEEDVVEEYCDSGDNNYYEIYGAYEVAQSFTPIIDHDVTFVQLKLAKYGTDWVGGIDVSITATDGSGLPTGAALCSDNVDSSAVSSTPSWVSFDLGAGTTLTAGTKYAIVVAASGANYFDNILYWRSSPNTYSGGNSIQGDGMGGWTAQTYDNMFREGYALGLLLDVDSVNVDAQPLSVGVTGNANNWYFYPYSYWNYYKYWVGGVQMLQYAPERIVGNSTYSTGTVDVTNASASVTGQGTTFTYNMIGSLFAVTGDTLLYQIIGFTDSTHITLDRIYEGTTKFGETYGIAPGIQDEYNHLYYAIPSWGTNPADFTASISALSSYSTSGAAPTTTLPPDEMVKVDLDSGAMVRADSEVNALVNTNIFTPYWQPFSTITNIPVIVFIMAIATVLLIIAVVWVMRHTNNQLVGSFVLVVGEAILWKAGIYELWMLIITVFICGAIIVFERKPSL